MNGLISTTWRVYGFMFSSMRSRLHPTNKTSYAPLCAHVTYKRVSWWLKKLVRLNPVMDTLQSSCMTRSEALGQQKRKRLFVVTCRFCAVVVGGLKKLGGELWRCDSKHAVVVDRQWPIFECRNAPGSEVCQYRFGPRHLSANHSRVATCDQMPVS